MGPWLTVLVIGVFQHPLKFKFQRHCTVMILARFVASCMMLKHSGDMAVKSLYRQLSPALKPKQEVTPLYVSTGKDPTLCSPSWIRWCPDVPRPHFNNQKDLWIYLFLPGLKMISLLLCNSYLMFKHLCHGGK